MKGNTPLKIEEPVKAGVAAGVTSWGIEIHLVDVDSGPCRLSRYGDSAQSSHDTCDQKGANAHLGTPELTVVSALDGEMNVDR
jgi:hypothetical protein